MAPHLLRCLQQRLQLQAEMRRLLAASKILHQILPAIVAKLGSESLKPLLSAHDAGEAVFCCNVMACERDALRLILGSHLHSHGDDFERLKVERDGTV